MRGHVHPKWGLRQGCTGSPILWAAVTALLCATIDQHIQPGWVQEHLTLYADDSHLRWRFATGADFDKTMNELRQVFLCFKKFHLRINLEKTKAILKIVGNMKHRIYKQHVRKHPNGRRLLLMSGDPSQWLSLVAQAEYLGLIISYDQFEQQSLRHRISKARRWALASILHSTKVSISYKLSVWNSCVYSTMLYGLTTRGLSGDQVKELQRAIMKHVRAIVNNQAHLTGDTHESIMTRYPIPRAAEDLRRDLLRAADRQQATPDWMFQDGWQAHLCRRLQLSEMTVWTPFSGPAPFVQTCFPPRPRLKCMRNAHINIPTGLTLLHSVGGLPTCRFCGKQFSRWQTLAQHITQNRCPKHRPDLHAEKHIFDTYDHMSLPLTREAPDRSTAEALETPHPPSSEVDIICNKSEVVAAAQKGLNAFIRLPAVTARLLQTCALCGQWIASHRTMKRHYRYSHSDILHALGGRVRTIIQRTATACPTCHFCHVQCKDWREHIMKCTVIYQCAVMCLISQDGCRNGAGSVLRGCEAGGQRTQAKAATRGLQGNSRLSSGPVSGDAAPRVLLSHFFGKAACTAGRGDQGVTPGRRIDLLHEAGRAQHVVPSLPHGTAVSEEASRESRVEAGPTTSQGDHGGGDVHRARRRRLDRACQEEDFAQKVKDLGWRDPAVGWRFQCWNPAVRHRSGWTLAKAHAASRSGAPLLLHQTINRDNGGDGYLHAGSIHSHTSESRSLELSSGPPGVYSSSVGGHCLQARGIQAQPGHCQDQGNATGTVSGPTPRLVLLNRGRNLCYMNSLVQAWHWLLQLCPDRLRMMGTGRTFFQTLQAHPVYNPKNLMKDTHWRALVTGWSDHHRQHDVAEFFWFMCQRHSFLLFQGQWEARRVHQGHLQTRDTGLCTQPVLLTLPRTPPGLDVRVQVQSLLDYWSGASKAVHAFSDLPSVLTLQLERFINIGGTIQKRKDPVDVDDILIIPIFSGAGMQVKIARYQLVASIPHHGQHPRMGHYTTHSPHCNLVNMSSCSASDEACVSAARQSVQPGPDRWRIGS